MEMQTTVGTPIFAIIVHKYQLKLMGLVHAMRSNGPLPQVSKLAIWGDSESGHEIIIGSSVATVATDIFQLNWFSMGNKIGKIAKIFVKIEDPENRGVIQGAETFSALFPELFPISWLTQTSQSQSANWK